MSDQKPLVSICCITYNHALYIKQAIEGFLMQKTSFTYEILIHDDASTDGTKEIIKGYEERFPNIIFPIYQTENQYSKGIRTSYFNTKRAAGEYIALCEGDDYWTDPYKLQKQVDFLDKNPTCSMVFTGCEIHKYGVGKRVYTYPELRFLSASDYLKKELLIATASLLFVKSVIPLSYSEDWMIRSFAGDFILKNCSLIVGNIGHIPDITCVYNNGVPGSWTTRRFSKKELLKEFSDKIRGLNYLNRHREIDRNVISIKIRSYRALFFAKYSFTLGGFQGFCFLLSKYPSVSLYTIGSALKIILLRSMRFNKSFLLYSASPF